jgi:DnaJ-domain-containing protein 1
MRPPRGALMDDPLRPREYLSGRRRARDRASASTPAPAPAARRAPPREREPAADPRQLAALRVLGVAPGSDTTVIKRAYRQLARHYHPDLHPDASEAEKRALAQRFVEVTAAYQLLVA